MDNKKLLQALLASVFITSLISGCVGAVAYFLKSSFWVFFFAATGLQILISAVVSSFRSEKRQIQLAEIQAMEKLADSHQEVQLTCSYCQELNIVPILLNQDNPFDCAKCGETNSVIIQYATARITTPLYADATTEDIKESK